MNKKEHKIYVNGAKSLGCVRIGGERCSERNLLKSFFHSFYDEKFEGASASSDTLEMSFENDRDLQLSVYLSSKKC